MNHIEGDYNEIVKSLDEDFRARGIHSYWWSHGMSVLDDEGDSYTLNFGLFSVCRDRKVSNTESTVCFDVTEVTVLKHPVAVENPEISHLTVF